MYPGRAHVAGEYMRSTLKKDIQSNTLNGSPDNGSIRLLVQVIASPNCMPAAEPLSGFDCNIEY